MFINVILPVPIAKLFTYNVPTEMESSISVGSRVVVQFGRKKSYSAIVHELNVPEPMGYKAKDIDAIIDSTPIITERQLQLWQWIADYYVCSLGEVYKAAMPSGLKLESETHLTYNHMFEATSPLSPRQEMILNFIEQNNNCTISDLTSHIGGANPIPQLKKLMDMEALYISEQLKDAYKPKTESAYKLSNICRENEDEFLAKMDALSRAPKQQEALMLFIQLGGGLGQISLGKAVRREELAKRDVTTAVLNELVKKGILVCEKQEVSRLNNRLSDLIPPHDLSEAQAKALSEIKHCFSEENKHIVLLNGVTSSGKTELYIHLIHETLQQGKQVLYLLPEIALTTQITSRLQKHFGDTLGIYHSKFNDAQRVELWNNLLSDHPYGLILGVRSAVLLPFSNLGLIIVDEEHESSFKQYDPAPRYNARDMAVLMSSFHNANVLLGSATPSLESYNNAISGRYGYVELTTRYADVALPHIETVDMSAARKHKEVSGLFSFSLRDRIIKALNNKEQVILFQNRRGFAPYVECHQCAWTAKCINCDVSMTYHKNTGELVCHYCGARAVLPLVCPACGTASIELQGYGTEKIEEEVQSLFPEARVVRMDLDTARTRKAFEQIISDFEQYKYDILIGTQMISKGLDFDRVSTVGILNVDNMLNIPDFRAYERAFAMVSQVAGRAGRRGTRGHVLLQTKQIDSHVVTNSVNNNYKANAEREMDERKRYGYPPFVRLIHITIKHIDELEALRGATIIANELTQIFGRRILGPQPPTIARMQNLYLQRIILKMEKTANPAKVKELLMDKINQILGDHSFKGTSVVVDVDPY
ncbi:MAG: primosomal protein N' [Bacteroidia bacterium]|nr:primosomal protein N' [Bacteroidia bacterium]